MKYKIEILSPVHIGSGNEISPIEYVVDNKFYRIDMDSLFKDERFSIDDFIENAKLESFYLGEFYGEIAKTHKRYVLEISNSAKNSIIKRRREVREFIKTGGRIYIPGSSIKGGIRTAILWYILKENAELYFEVEGYLEEIIHGSKKKPQKKYVDNEIEKLVFGKDPNHDLLKALTISDTNTTSFDSLSVEDVHILSTRRNGYGWKGFSILVEALHPGTTFEIKIDKDKFFTKEIVSKELGFLNKINYLDKLKDICNDYAKDFIEYELKFLNTYNDGNLDEIIKFYEKLENVNGILLHISWGSGWHGITVGRLIDEIILDRLRRIYRLGMRKNDPRYVKPFPKTRRFVFENDKPKYPLGWIKLEEIK